jgi:hypothetical protein
MVAANHARRLSARSVAGLFLTLLVLTYVLWSPGDALRDGRHDRGRNGIWLSHGWLGADTWFVEYDRSQERFRDPARVADLARRLDRHHITDIYPHLAPTTAQGRLPPLDPAQTERFLDQMAGMRVMPWVGGLLGEHVFPRSVSWRRTFVTEVRRLLHAHPRLAGIHLNVEPLPTGNRAYLTLLEELRQVLPPGKVLSVAAYPPPTIWQRAPEIHWDQAYYRQVAHRADQLVVMMYDTGLPLGKVYVSVLAGWTEDVLTWVPDGDVLLGLPAYEDIALYHWPWAENLKNGLRGVHAGLGRLDESPCGYQGIAIYSQWTMAEREWMRLERGFLR